MTKQYRHQLRLRAHGKCPGCHDPVARFIYCLSCRVIRARWVKRWHRQQRRAKVAS